MEREKLESMLIDFIDGKLHERDRQLIEKELATNEEAFALYTQLKEVMSVMDRASTYQPSANLKTSFDALLKEEIASGKKGKVIFFHPNMYRVAAAVLLLMVGVGLGFWINKYQQQQDRIAAIDGELKKTKELMMAMLDNQQSPSQRLMGVKAAYSTANPDTEIVESLLKLMDEDPNSNVRIAAIEALKKFNKEGAVRKALIASLTKQTDPTVQIALIQLLVEMKEKDALKPLQNIIDNEEVLPAVRDEAHAGIFKLS